MTGDHVGEEWSEVFDVGAVASACGGMIYGTRITLEAVLEVL
jgi:hypothetical protein